MKQPFFTYVGMNDAEEQHMHTIELLSRLQNDTDSLQALHNLFSYNDDRLKTTVFGLDFTNPIGVAAGFDKWGRAVNTLLALGFSHVEVGTVTPLAQPGNPTPRMFRLPQDTALINRFGFNNDGSDALIKTLAHYSPRMFGGIIGGNLGANKTSSEKGDPVPDYVSLIKTMHSSVDYLTMNISSPNTARLRELHGHAALDSLLSSVQEARKKHCPNKPLLLKIAPDLTNDEIDDILQAVKKHSIDGIIATNTTVERPESLQSEHKAETGGLSGEPVKKRSTEIISYIYKQTKGTVPVIGVGGIITGADAIEKIQAGASLIQIYTGLVYEGPALATRICLDLATYLEREGLSSVTDLVGTA